MSILYKNEVNEMLVPFKKVCNRCGKEISRDDEDAWIDWQEFFHIDFCGGYGSVWGDGTSVSIDLCQECSLEILKKYATTEELW